MATAKAQVVSIGLHAAVLATLFWLASRNNPMAFVPATHGRITPLTLPHFPIAPELRRGGSNQTLLPPRRGTPPPTTRRTFIPPASSEHSLLALPITVSFDVPPVDTPPPDIGDPFSHLVEGGLGGHGRNGIGDQGCCGGIGDSQSGQPGSSAGRSSGVTRPQLLYKVEPEFSEEARRAKHQGVVVLTIEVDASGNVRNIRVRQGLGLGLDEKAIEAVSHWHFRPGALNGKPVTTEAVIQVNFQLL